MVTPESIQVSLEAGLPCDHVAVSGDGAHFEAVIVSAAFAGLSRVRQHQLVYAALKGQMGSELHALALETSAPPSSPAGD